MKVEDTSHSQILRSSTVIGGASLIHILVGLVRIKYLAIIFGPTGVGIAGIFQSLMTTASTVAALGFGNVGTRQISEAMARRDQEYIDAARRALFWGTVCLGLIGTIAFYSMKDVTAQFILNDIEFSAPLGWLSIGVGLSVAAGSQAALLRGMRRVGDLARISIFSSIWSAALGLVCLLLLPSTFGLVWFVLATPIASFVLGHWYVAKLSKIQSSMTPISLLVKQWKTLAHLGIAFMVAGLVTALGQLLVRTIIKSEVGVIELGYFQASWSISMTYIGFVLNAMGADYYPRLTEAIYDPCKINKLVNEQAQVSILLAAPVLIAMLGFAPWVLEILYSEEFLPAVEILRWQILGDVLKVASWPVGFVLLALGKGALFLGTEVIVVSIFVVITWLLLPEIGIASSGIAFFLMYLVHLPLMMVVIHSITKFEWEKRVVIDFLILAMAAILVFLAGSWSSLIGALLGTALTLTLGVYSLLRLATMVEITGKLGKAIAMLRAKIR